jgi:hypothetical protein
MAFVLGGRYEVLGASHGAQWRAGTGLIRYRPEIGWAESEARRIREVARPDVWLFISHSYGLERFLYREMEALGARLEAHHAGHGAVLRKYRFPKTLP